MQSPAINGFRLSPQQEHLWLLQQQHHSQTYRAQFALRLTGPFDREVLDAALDQIVERDEILRTTFCRWPGMTVPLQVITDAKRSATDYQDFSDVDTQEQESRIAALFQEMGERVFDLEAGPAFSTTLIRLSPRSHVLLGNLPALCADARGLHELCHTICDAYVACLQKRTPSGEPMQYADIAAWQNELIESTAAAIGKAYWRDNAIPDPLSLPLVVDKPAMALDGFAPQSLTRSISSETLANIEMLCAASAATVSDFLLACWNVLLWRLTGEQEIVIGAACDGRMDEELKSALGLFAKYVPIHCRPAKNLSFYQLLDQVRNLTREAYKWQECFTWESSAEESREEEPSYCAYSFDFMEEPSDYVVNDLSFSISRVHVCIDRFKVKLSCICTHDAVHTEFHFDPNLMRAEDIERLGAQFHQLLESITHTPEQAIGTLNILDEAEHQRLLFEFNDTQRDYPAEQTLHQLFEAQVERTPANLAVTDAGNALTYDQLNRRANKLAHHLRRLGVAPDTPVALFLTPGVEMLVGVLAILKAGGAYVPLDLSHPQSRLAFILEETAAPVVLTQSHVLQQLPPHRATVVCLDRDFNTAVDHTTEADNPPQFSTPAHLAYIIYTSGSTGVPKGVMVTHGSVVNYLCWCIEAYRVAEGSGAPVHSPLGFDLTVTSLWSPLLAGGLVEIVSEQVSSVESLAAALRQSEGYSLVKLTPSHLELLDQQLDVEEMSGKAGALVIGGEALRAESLCQWRRHAPATRLINEYGPTETTVGCCVYEVRTDTAESGVVPIGRAIANTQMYVLDGAMQPAPIGVTNDIYIGGAGLARGYWRRADLTAERFVPHPFSREAGARLYRTGDLGRYRADGEIEYLGRLDEQVKLRGYRIELGEIEAVLTEHPAISQAVVVLCEVRPNDKQLVAYLLGEPGSDLNLSDLRSFLSERLPAYMIPVTFVSVDALPLTPNGKVDRRALPDPVEAVSRLQNTFVPPRTFVEELLAGIWADVLGLDRVGIRDNFFELGGHSLMAMQMVSRVREIFQVELALSKLFESPTIAGLAVVIELARRDENHPPSPPIVPLPRGGPMPLSYAQQRLWFLYQLQPASPALNIYYAMRLSGMLNASALERSVNEVVRRHEALRTVFANGEDEAVQIVLPPVCLAFPVLDLQELTEDEQSAEVERLAREDALRPFDLARGPLLRATLLKLGVDEHVLLLSMHHIASDGWSMGVLVRELITLYEAFAAGESSPLAELMIQYSDYAQWQRQWLSGAVLEEQLDYWRKQLAGSPALLELPLDHPRPAMPSFRGGKHSFIVPIQVAESLKRLSRQEDATLFMILLAAWNVLLQRYTWQDDIVVGTNIANRNRAEVESLIGFFVNNLVLRTDLSGNPTFREFLKRVRRVTLEAYEHHDVPFEMVIEALPQAYDPRYTPLFQVLLVLQNAPIPAVELTGLRVSAMKATEGSSKFDLALYVNETEHGLAGLLEYNSDLFEPGTIERMESHFQSLLEDITASPDKHLKSLSAGKAEESGELVYAFNDDTE